MQEKQIQKIDSSLEKVDEGFERVYNFDFINLGLVESYLKKREKILLKSKAKILKLSKRALVESFI